MHPIRRLCGAVLVATAAAQVPPGWLLVSAQSETQNGGLYLLRPRDFGLPPIGPSGSLWVQGLPPDLIGQNDGQLRGASGVEIQQDTGLVLVGEAGPAGTTIEVRWLQLAVGGGSAQATVLTQATLGVVVAAAGGVDDTALLPNGDLVLCVNGLAALPPLSGERLARFSPFSGAVTPIVTDAPAGTIESVAVDPTGTTLYFHVRPPGSPTQGQLLRCPVGGGATTALRNISHFAAMTTDDRGHLHAVGSTFSFELEPITGATVTVQLFNLSTKGVAIERATQTPLYLIGDPFSATGPVGGVFLGGPGASIPGFVTTRGTGIAVRHSPQPYGAETGSAVSFTWGRPASPSLPLPGNLGFAVQVDASDGGAHPGLLFASAQPAALQAAGVDVWIDLGAAALLGVATSGQPFALPIPATLPPGTIAYLQAAFADATLPGGLAATDGLRLGVVQ